MLPELLGDRLEVFVIKQDLKLDTIDPDDGVIRVGFFGGLNKRGGRRADNEFNDPAGDRWRAREQKGSSRLSDPGGRKKGA